MLDDLVLGLPPKIRGLDPDGFAQDCVRVDRHACVMEDQITGGDGHCKHKHPGNCGGWHHRTQDTSKSREWPF